MRKRRGQTRENQFVSAKELAEMGFCEKRVLLTHLHGQRLTPEQRRSVERGLRAHEQYQREGLAAASRTPTDRRCFVATELFGDAAWQTERLRRFRDEVLIGHRLGRSAIAIYYTVSPGTCRLIALLPWLRAPARALVSMLVRVVSRTGRWGGS